MLICCDVAMLSHGCEPKLIYMLCHNLGKSHHQLPHRSRGWNVAEGWAVGRLPDQCPKGTSRRVGGGRLRPCRPGRGGGMGVVHGDAAAGRVDAGGAAPLCRRTTGRLQAGGMQLSLEACLASLL